LGVVPTLGQGRNDAPRHAPRDAEASAACDRSGRRHRRARRALALARGRRLPTASSRPSFESTVRNQPPSEAVTHGEPSSVIFVNGSGLADFSWASLPAPPLRGLPAAKRHRATPGERSFVIFVSGFGGSDFSLPTASQPARPFRARPATARAWATPGKRSFVIFVSGSGVADFSTRATSLLPDP